MIDETQKVAGMGVPPPLLYGGTLGLGLLLHRFFPRSMLPRSVARVVGGALVGQEGRKACRLGLQALCQAARLPAKGEVPEHTMSWAKGC